MKTALLRCALMAWIAGALPASAAQPSPGAWAQSPHAAMLERVLPPAVTPAQLPDPGSPGAKLLLRYCVQCHHLASPAMHTPEKWRGIVVRMIWRMEGMGNLGAAMKELMDPLRAPTPAEVDLLVAYLAKHGQREIDPKHPALATPTGRSFELACSQCHAVPDPGRHTAREWPAVVDRMRRHMAWANIVTGPEGLRTTPELRTDDIVRLLQRYGRRDAR